MYCDSFSTRAEPLCARALQSLSDNFSFTSSRCQCDQCNTEILVGALEFRCCREITSLSAKVSFYGSIERIDCITQHEDFDADTNFVVLLQVAPLLRSQDGGT